jgi:hypothetical protein
MEGRAVYVVADADEPTKMRKRAVAQARSVLIDEGLIKDGLKLEPDWAAGQIFVTRDGDEFCLGSFSMKKGFVCDQSELRKVLPEVTAEHLSTCMSELD